MSVEIVPLALRIGEDESFLSYDDRLNRVILKTQSGFGYVLLDDPEANRKYYSSDKQIKDAKFSPNLKYSAIQFNDCDIEILHLENGTRYIQSCKYKSSKGTTILGFYWTQNDNILLVTNVSLELYAMSVDGSCKLVKESKMKISNCVYSFNCNFGVLFLHSGGTSIQPYFFRPNSFDKLPKFNIEGTNSQNFNINNLYVTKLHEKFFCVYGDTDYIYLYEMTLETIYKIKPIKILLPGPNTIHFVDNLIIVHSELKISIVYDLKMIQRDRDRGINNKKEPEFPISAIPLTVSLQNSNNLNHLIQIATQSPQTSLKYKQEQQQINLMQQQFQQQSLDQQQHMMMMMMGNGMDQQQLQQQLQQQQLLARLNNNLYSKSWKYVCPHYIFDSDTGIWFEVTLNFEKISNFLQFDPHKTIPFLQERTLPSAKFALLALIKTIIEFKTDTLDGIGKIYDDLNKVLFRTTNRQLTESLHKSLNQSSSSQQQQSSSSSLSSSSQSVNNGLSNSANGILIGNGLNSSNENTPTVSPTNSFIGNSRLIPNNNAVGSNTTSSSTGTTPTSSNVNNLSYIRHKQLQQQQQQQQLAAQHQQQQQPSNQQASNNNSNNEENEEDPFDLIGDAPYISNYSSPKSNYKFNSLSQSSPSSPSSPSHHYHNNKSTLSSSTSGSTLNINNQGGNTTTHVVPSRQSRSNQYILINSHDMYDYVFNPIYEKLLADSQLQHQQHQQHQQQQQQQQQQQNNNNNNEQYPILDDTNQKLTLDSKYLIAVVIQYIKSLSFNQCTGISDKLYDLLISLLIDNNMFSKLHQFLQYYVITDSLPIAYKLLSIGEQYPPVLQLSLDMFKRLSMPNIIIETLLERNQVIQAIRLLRSTKETNPQLYQELLNPNYPINFLQVSSNQNNDTLFFSVFKFFEENGLILPHLQSFDKFIRLFIEKFSEKSLSPQLLDSINNFKNNINLNNSNNNITPKKTSPVLRSSNNNSLNSSPKLQSSNQHL